MWLKPRVSWGPIPHARFSPVCFQHGSHIYVLGGKTKVPSAAEANLIYRFDPASMTWETLVTSGQLPPDDAKLPSTCAYYDGNLYALDGKYSMQGTLSAVDVYILDLSTLSWSTVRSTGTFPETFIEACLVPGKNCLWLFGGYASYQWIECRGPNMPAPRASCAGVVYGNDLLILGGRSFSTAVPYLSMTIHAFDIEKKMWRSVGTATEAPPPRECFSMVVSNNKLIVFGGYNAEMRSNCYINEVYTFDLNTLHASTVQNYGKWEKIKPSQWAPSPRCDAAVATFGSDVYIFGGRQGWDNYYNDLHVLRLSEDLSGLHHTSITKFLGKKNKSTDKSECIKSSEEKASSANENGDANEGSANANEADQAQTSNTEGSQDNTSAPKDKDSSSDKTEGDGSAKKKVTFDANTKEEEEPEAKPEPPKLPDGFTERLAWAVDNKQAFPDVAFKLNDSYIYAHKCMLSARSVVFRKRWEKPSNGTPTKKRDSDDDESASQLDVSVESAAPSIKRRGTPVSSPKQPPRPVETMAGPDGSEIEVITITEDFEKEDFLSVLRYIYTGKIEIKNADHAESISSIAYEFLLDDLMKLCRLKTCLTHEEPMPQLARSLRRMVGSPIGSDIFFVVKRKKLFAHRVILYIFSSYFKSLLDQKANRRYIEIKELPPEEASVHTFVEFCRMMYCYFTAIPEHKDKQLDAPSLLHLGLTYKEDRLVELISKHNILSPENVMQTYEIALKHDILYLQETCLSYVMKNFSSLVKDKEFLSKISSSTLKDILEIYMGGPYNWLDLLWFAHHTNNNDLKDKAAKELESLINIENVVQVMTCAHSCGEKSLRSACIDFILAHSTNVEEVQRMQHFSETKIAKITNLSSSVATEVEQKVADQLAQQAKQHQKSKRCTLCNTVFSIFGSNKKGNCALCKRAACNNCIHKNQQTPAVFGYGNKPKSICKQCMQLVSILKPQ